MRFRFEWERTQRSSTFPGRYTTKNGVIEAFVIRADQVEGGYEQGTPLLSGMESNMGNRQIEVELRQRDMQVHIKPPNPSCYAAITGL